MAAAVQVETVNITINDVDLAVPKGELIVESVKRLGLEIPIFCYHARMKPVGMCRMCIVEVGFKQPDDSVRKMPKPQAACTLPASEGMAVYTDSEMVHRDRRGVLEFLLINHPLDCPICDRGGECPLQNNTLFYGPSTTRFLEIKRHAPKAFPLSKHVTLDLERCIQCGRCVRFTEEISGDAELAFRFRGADMQPSTFEMRDFGSKFSGNVIEICPVGALTSSQYRFRARPWDLQTKPAICTLCSNGCSVWFDYRVGQMVRINGRVNEGVNEEWTCDRGKFGHEFYNSSERLETAMVRQNDQLIESDWARAYSEVIRVFANSGPESAILGGELNSNEDLFAMNRLATEILRIGHIATGCAAESSTKVTTRIADIESASSILVFGTSLADELPILYLRVRKAWFNNGAEVVVAHHQATDADSFAHVVLRYREGSEAALAKGLAELIGGGSGADQIEKQTGVPADLLREAAAALKGATVITTNGISSATEPDLSKIGPFNRYGRAANEEGASLLMPPRGESATAILEGCRDGKIKALWLLNSDPFQSAFDRDLVTQALENVEFLVWQGPLKSEPANYASVVLPQSAPAEQDGTYVNVERRVQRMQPVLGTRGEAKAGWQIATEIQVRLRPAAPSFNALEVMDELAAKHPSFEGARYASLPEDGYLLDLQ